MNSKKRVTFDEFLDAFSDVQRRKLLIALMDHNPQNNLPVVIAEDGVAEMSRLVEMRHVHLPKLVDYGFIEWDRDKNEVSKGPKFDEIQPLLELLENHDEELPPGWL